MADGTALERARLTIRGVRAELVLEDGRFTLTKEGPPPTSVTVSVDRVRSTAIEPGSRGWIHLSVVGGSSTPPGELAAMSDPYTLPLTSRSAVTARRLARLVEKHVHERGVPSEPAFADALATGGRFSSAVSLTRGPAPVRLSPDRADATSPHLIVSSLPSEPPPPGPPAPPRPSVPPPGDELTTQLRQLGELHTAGVLTDAEFERAKARLLG